MRKFEDITIANSEDEVMRIGIVTQPLENNIGGDLQNWALQQVLKKMGHDPITIDFHPDRPAIGLRTRLSIFKANLIIAAQRLGGGKARFLRIPTAKPLSHRQKFFAHHYNLTEPTNHYTDIEGIDAYITGSDQVWRPMYNMSLPSMFLDFVTDSKIKIAYAASFGVDNWEFTPVQENECGQAARRLDAVSVREAGGIRLCQKHFGIDAVQVVDPTLLLNSEDYMTLCKDIQPQLPFVHAYILDPNRETEIAVESIENATELKVRDAHPVNTPEAKWLAAFRDCSYVLTDSFHGCVFSIIFQKPFVVIGNAARGMARFESLLGTYDLASRLCSNAEDAAKIIKRPIDWEKVDEELAKQREKSIDFLRNALSRK